MKPIHRKTICWIIIIFLWIAGILAIKSGDPIIGVFIMVASFLLIPNRKKITPT
jgi:hypothetical protein